MAKSTEDFSPLTSLKILDLSRNNLQVLHSIVFVSLPSLQTLNLSHNQIHTVSEGAFVLPSLVELDLSHNAMTEAPPHLFDTSPHIEVIQFSHNSLSRLLGNIFMFSKSFGTSFFQEMFDQSRSYKEDHLTRNFYFRKILILI